MPCFRKTKIGATGSTGPSNAAGAAVAAGADSAQTVLRVEGMTCSHCKMAVEKALSSLPGVKSAAVDLGAKTATVNHTPGQAEVDAYIRAVEDAGYKVVR
ncbi:MAG: cation transporter [Clostridia bacterium]|nr:cation transporter [Clostridia bacterium]